MSKIIGNTTATPMAIPDWKQTDPMKADYIKNKLTKLSELQDDLELITIADIDTICGSTIQVATASEVTF